MKILKISISFLLYEGDKNLYEKKDLPINCNIINKFIYI